MRGRPSRRVPSRGRGGPVRLCIVTHEYPPFTPHAGGIGYQYATLAPALARRGHDVHVVGLSAGAAATLEHEGVQLHMLARPNPLARLGRAAADLWVVEPVHWARSVAREIARLGPFDLVYAAETGGDAALYARRAGQGRLVTNLQMSLAQMLAVSPGLRLSPIPARSLLQRRLERMQAERSGGIAACSNAILAWTRRLWEVADVPSVVLPNTTDVQRVRELARREPPPDATSNGPVVAFSGRLEPRKGAHVLVEAMRRIWPRHPDARLVMVGADLWTRPPMSDRLLELAGPHRGQLRLLGPRPHEELFPILAAADVVALPSLWEAFGIAALEAMAIGRPVVLTTGSGFDDFASHEENALMVPPSDAAALAGAIERLLADPDLAGRLSKAAARRAERFDVEPVADLHAEMLPALARRS